MRSEEESLLLQLQAGSESAWDEAFHRLYPCVLAAAHHPLAALTPTEAEDVAIEALTQLVPKVATVKTWNELRALAVTIAGRRAISEKRKLTADKRGSGQTESIEALNERSEGVFEPADFVESINPTELRELADLLHEAMRDLEEPTGKMIRDFIVMGVSYKDLAEKYRLPVGTVGVNLYRGLKKIRSCIEKSPRLMKEVNAYLRY